METRTIETRAAHAGTGGSGLRATAELGAVERANDYIRQAYERLAALPGFIFRDEQRALSQALAKAWLTNTPLAAQAPTGTGKTIAYLVAGLAAQQQMSASRQLVVATATKALQAQLLATDLQWLARAGLINPDEAVLAKGKSNYLCMRDAREVAETARNAKYDPEAFLSEDDSDYADADMAQELLDAYVNESWDGDFDTYAAARPKSARLFAVNGDTCTGRKCPHYQACAYYRARRRIEHARIVVTNQDLLLLNLKASQDGIEPMLKGSFLLLVDEAHHLPEKAISVGARELAPTRLMLELQRIAPALNGLHEDKTLGALFAGRHIDETPLAGALRALETELAEQGVREDSGMRRFPRGELPDSLEASVQRAYVLALRLYGEVSGLIQELKALISESAFSGSRTRIGETFRRLAPVNAELEETVRAGAALLDKRASVKWSHRNGSAWFLHYSPLEGAQVLEPLLWSTDTARTCLVSATLADTSGFARYRKRVGLPARGETLATPYVLPYDRSRLVVAAMRHTPKQGERVQFLRELHEKLPAAIDARQATLVLFPSWSMLRELTPTLTDAFGAKRVRAQGQMPVKLLVAAHCAEVDAGHGAILAGVASMSEGLDLPGQYCEHVCVVSLPFAVPSGPLEEEVAEMLGSKYFAERSLPDATLRLIQMCGRLVRRESDVGRITVFDRRLAAMNYGREMLKALPPFTRVIEPIRPVAHAV